MLNIVARTRLSSVSYGTQNLVKTTILKMFFLCLAFWYVVCIFCSSFYVISLLIWSILFMSTWARMCWLKVENLRESFFVIGVLDRGVVLLCRCIWLSAWLKQLVWKLSSTEPNLSSKLFSRFSGDSGFLPCSLLPTLGYCAYSNNLSSSFSTWPCVGYLLFSIVMFWSSITV